MNLTHTIEIGEFDLINVVLPNGQKISLTYDHIHPSESWPEVQITLPEKLTVNAWPDDRGKDESTVSEAVQLVIPVKPKTV